MKWRQAPRNQYILALGFSTLVSIGLFAYGAWRNHSLEFNYLLWNLMLAWLPLVFAVRLVSVLQRKLWSSWEALGWSLLWLLFLPNSFYMHPLPEDRRDPNIHPDLRRDPRCIVKEQAAWGEWTRMSNEEADRLMAEFDKWDTKHAKQHFIHKMERKLHYKEQAQRV